MISPLDSSAVVSLLALRRKAWVGGLVITAATLILLVATEPRLAIVWDEGFILGREERVRLWFRAVRDPAAFAAAWVPPSLLIELIEPDSRPPPVASEINTRAKLFDPYVLEWFWPFSRGEPYGHPPFSALIGLAGDVLAPTWAVLPRARLGPMLVFSLTAGILYAFMARRLGVVPGAATVATFVLQPRLFAHAHYAHYDNILTCLWVTSIVAFTKAVEPSGPRPFRMTPRWVWVAVFGMLAAAAAATKLTGWFLPLPFVAWTLFYRDRRAALTLLAGGVIAALTLYALTPPWWNNPVAGAERFLLANLTRAQTSRIPTQFLGSVILTPKDSLPWYNTLVWTLFVTPAGFLILALVGAGSIVRHAKSEPLGVLALGYWVFVLALRALPHTPGHDGERQFLAAFGALALVAGFGAKAACGMGLWGKVLVAGAWRKGRFRSP